MHIYCCLGHFRYLTVSAQKLTLLLANANLFSFSFVFFCREREVHERTESSEIDVRLVLSRLPPNFNSTSLSSVHF